VASPPGWWLLGSVAGAGDGFVDTCRATVICTKLSFVIVSSDRSNGGVVNLAL
jgi:hypothetical protein